MKVFAETTRFHKHVLFCCIFFGSFYKSQGGDIVFFNEDHFQGDSLAVGISGGCYNLKRLWQKKISSIQVAPDSCMIVWTSADCTGESLKLMENSKEAQALKNGVFDKKIMSVSLCAEISFRAPIEFDDRMWNPTRRVLNGDEKKGDPSAPAPGTGLRSSVMRQRVELNFFDSANFKGSVLTVLTNGDCYNFKPRWVDRVSSVDSGKRCLIFWDRLNCEGRQAVVSLEDARDFENLDRLRFNKRAKSFRLCKTPVVEVLNQESSKENAGKKLEHGESQPTNKQRGGSTRDRAIVEPKNDNTNDEEIRRVALEEHNKLRKLHGVPDLKWDFKIQSTAQAHADWLVQHNKFEHSSNDDLGENIGGISTPNKLEALKEAVTLWYNEIHNYDFKNPRRSVLEIKAGHFTQIVWKATTHIGLGIAWNPKRRWYVVVCNYSPPGNYKGVYEKNVFPPNRSLPKEE